MRSDHMEWNMTVFEQSNEKRTRNTKNVRRALRREVLMLRDDGDRLTRLKAFQNLEQKFLDRIRQFDLPTIWCYKACGTLFDQPLKFRHLDGFSLRKCNR